MRVGYFSILVLTAFRRCSAHHRHRGSQQLNPRYRHWTRSQSGSSPQLEHIYWRQTELKKMLQIFLKKTTKILTTTNIPRIFASIECGAADPNPWRTFCNFAFLTLMFASLMIKHSTIAMFFTRTAKWSGVFLSSSRTSTYAPWASSQSTPFTSFRSTSSWSADLPLINESILDLVLSTLATSWGTGSWGSFCSRSKTEKKNYNKILQVLYWTIN